VLEDAAGLAVRMEGSNSRVLSSVRGIFSSRRFWKQENIVRSVRVELAVYSLFSSRGRSFPARLALAVS
jgi:hypothetical protein